MARDIVTPSGDRAPLGPYSIAVRAGGLVHVAGQLGWDFASESLAGADCESQARVAFENLAATLADAGASIAEVVKVNVYLADIDDAPALNAVWVDVFGNEAPARSTMAVAGLPKDALIEIDAIATHRR